MMSSSVAAGDRPRVPAAPAPPPTRTRFAWLKNLSIRWKLMGAFGALIGAIVVFQMLYFPARQAAQAKVDLRAKGRSIASLVAHDVKAAFEFGDAKAVEEVFAGTRDDPDLAFLGLLDASGQRFASRGTAPGPLDTFARGAAREELSDQHFTLSLPVETAGGTHGMLVASFHLARITTRRREDQFTVVTTGLTLLAGGLFVTFIVSSYVGRRLARFGRLTAGVAEGDLMPGEHALDTQADDEIGGLSRNLDRMVGNLRGMVHDIKEASVQVATSAEEISANSRRITERAQNQAGAADETATSMEQMATSIDAVAATAQSLASHVESTSTSIAQMGASIEHVARSSATLADTVAGTYVTIDEMATSIDQMAGRLERMAATASETTAPVEEVATFIGAVARSGESLAEAAQRTQATIAELALAIDDVARLAGEADRFSQKASDDARAGDQAVERAITGMRRLSDTMDNTARVITRLGSRSLEIGRIVEVIEGIADQTNLLALNAAIEAARAGEAGRGFAVVADEVRKLAERSVTATSEIGDLVRQVQQETGDAVDTAKGGVAEAKEGIALADTAGLALRSIIESVTRSSALMGRIASATSTQSKASSEALETVSHMNQIAGEVTGSVRAQSEGSRRIRHAIETINHVMAEAAQSTKEQAVGGRLVRQAVDDMNRIASQLNVATKDQADGSRIIVSSVESMNRMTREVSRATSAQRATGEGVAHAVAKISSMARENLATVEETSRAIGNLVRQSEALAQLIAVFRS